MLSILWMIKRQNWPTQRDDSKEMMHFVQLEKLLHQQEIEFSGCVFGRLSNISCVQVLSFDVCSFSRCLRKKLNCKCGIYIGRYSLDTTKIPQPTRGRNVELDSWLERDVGLWLRQGGLVPAARIWKWDVILQKSTFSFQVGVWSVSYQANLQTFLQEPIIQTKTLQYIFSMTSTSWWFFSYLLMAQNVQFMSCKMRK